MSALDLVVIGLYFVLVLAIGLVIARRTKSGEDLFLAGRSLGWWAIGFSLFASNISSTTLIGLAGAAYATGISVDNYEWMAVHRRAHLGARAEAFPPGSLLSRLSGPVRGPPRAHGGGTVLLGTHRPEGMRLPPGKLPLAPFEALVLG